ncbi:MAG: twin-arginine translocation signal domain-containing protein [Gemmatimonadaceae bacterium]|nr:twin-arginine translocation signal domain-containing protein [Gemmatimonadaceae bacterium]
MTKPFSRRDWIKTAGVAGGTGAAGPGDRPGEHHASRDPGHGRPDRHSRRVRARRCG